MMKIYLGSDHAGFDVKEKLKKFLDKEGFRYVDMGAFEYKERDDYPDYGFKVAEKVSKTKNARGILICGSGVGMAIVANKVKGIRAAAAYDDYTASMSRLHNDTNVLELRGRKFPFNKTKKIVSIWLTTPFSEAKRHIRRIKKISDYEKK